MDVTFHVSSAGVAGDPHKLLVAECDAGRFMRLFNCWSLWSLRRARRKLLREVELKSGRPVRAL